VVSASYAGTYGLQPAGPYPASADEVGSLLNGGQLCVPQFFLIKAQFFPDESAIAKGQEA